MHKYIHYDSSWKLNSRHGIQALGGGGSAMENSQHNSKEPGIRDYTWPSGVGIIPGLVYPKAFAEMGGKEPPLEKDIKKPAV